MTDFKQDKTLKYMYAIIKDHPCADKYGKIYEHHYVMYNHIGRALEPDECVHHKDRDRTNNNIDNLQLMTKSDHARLHMEEDRNGGFVIKICESCGEEYECFKSKSHRRRTCSFLCANKHLSRFEISKEELEELVWKKPTTKIAEMFGVSDKAVEKRCKKFGISKPPRGYWSRKTE